MVGTFCHRNYNEIRLRSILLPSSCELIVKKKSKTPLKAFYPHTYLKFNDQMCLLFLF